MEKRLDAYLGCLLGLAAGDAMGYGVDHLRLSEIRQAHGPEGLLGYAPGGEAQITSYTQAAAYSSNGLLLWMTHGQMRGERRSPVGYVAVALQEWARVQGYRREKGVLDHCWISAEESMRQRRCKDTSMMDLLNQGRPGSLTDRRNRYQGPGGLAAAIPVGMVMDPRELPRQKIQRLGAETVALTHGDPKAFLAGAAAAYIISRVVWDGARDWKALAKEAAAMVRDTYGETFRQASEVAQDLEKALRLASDPSVPQGEALDALGCANASSVLAGALYACVLHPGSFDEGMITAVNHSGASCAVGAVAGAFLGAALGVSRIPEYYTGSLEQAPMLRTLAQDLHRGCPMGPGRGLFDAEWDAKYVTAAARN